jgi:ribosomal protein L17
MRHAVRKIKFTKGQDANQMIMKKLVSNFFIHGKLTSTEKRIKALKPVVDKVSYLIHDTRQNQNAVLSRYFTNLSLVELAKKNTPDQSSKKSGSVTRIVRLNRRESDGASMSQLVWSTGPAVVKEPEQSQSENKAAEEKKAKPKTIKKETKASQKTTAKKNDNKKEQKS